MRALLGFLEDRVGLLTLWRSSMSEKRPPAGIGWLRTLGFCALTIAVLQVCSGVALALHYVPAADLAYDSIRALEQDVPLGAFTRSLHHVGASAFIILLALHVARVFFTGAYKRPRELTWLTGVGLLLVVLLFGFTGYLLPWDQKAYFATKVGVEIAAQAPIAGDAVREIVAGGDSVGPPTLTRFYVIHVVLLPLALFALLGLHLFLIQRHGVAAPGLPVDDEGQPGEPYFPGHVFKEVVAALLITAVVSAIAAAGRAPLEAMAEPSDQGYDPRPDWYFSGLFQLLKLCKGPLETVGTFWGPSLLLAGMVLLPFVDRTRQRHWRRRPFTVGVGSAAIAVILGLTVVGALDSPTNATTLPAPLGLSSVERQGYLLVRRLKCIDCHSYQLPDGVVLGGSKEHPDAPHLDEIDQDAETVAAILQDPKGALSEDTEMPSFSHVGYEQRWAIGAYLRRLVHGAPKAPQSSGSAPQSSGSAPQSK